ncbi:hypothetical protein NDU88_002185 [Pleurodeles waltl]|uniref:Bromo domain-containing protein n=1 Tax=Pleurodeles waltl TaxID=8319 RepID=A0AAV7TMC9_PLEWA|nr:hypothetical protein NDU88_002185 [Pleurodeles waltl]
MSQSEDTGKKGIFIPCIDPSNNIELSSWPPRFPPGVTNRALRSHASDDERLCRDVHTLLSNAQRFRFPGPIPFIPSLLRLPCHSGSATQGFLKFCHNSLMECINHIKVQQGGKFRFGSEAFGSTLIIHYPVFFLTWTQCFAEQDDRRVERGQALLPRPPRISDASRRRKAAADADVEAARAEGGSPLHGLSELCRDSRRLERKRGGGPKGIIWSWRAFRFWLREREPSTNDIHGGESTCFPLIFGATQEKIRWE